jgi:hypothetical protein
MKYVFMIAIIILGSITLTNAATDSQVIDLANGRDVSIIQLLANPLEYDGARVQVIGSVRAVENNYCVYLSEFDAGHDITKNGLWLELPADIKENSGLYDGKVCLIEGIFDSGNNGYNELWNGTIRNIEKVTVMDNK